MKTRFLFLILSVFCLITGCGQNKSFHALDYPTETAKLKDLEGTEKDGTDELTENPELSNDDLDSVPEPTSQDTDKEKDQETESAETENETDKESVGHGSSGLPKAKASLLNTAKWVILHEARRVGPACNFYIQRVFKLMGFGRSSWKANDFDRYVKSSFQSYELKTFDMGTVATERRRLKNYLWSFPEKTPFLIQWKRRTGPGHVAIVHRNGNDLVIYHASLNRFNAKAQRINIETLIYQSRISTIVNVFSHLQK